MPTICEREEKQQALKITVPAKSSLFAPATILKALAASIIYLAISYFLIGFRSDQIVLVLLFNGLFFASRPTRSFILAFSIFIIYWIVFDYQKLIPNYTVSPVHIRDLYELEKSLFAFQWDGRLVTPNEFFSQNNLPFLDFLTGLFYLCWIPVPLGFAAALYFKKRPLFFQFALTFITVNLIGWTGYYTLPAAPPWYIAEHGFAFIANTPGNTAGLARFDALTGTTIFNGIYAKSSNVFAAMPSLHAAYVLIVSFYAFKARWRIGGVVFAITAMGIWFAAVYTSHHYVLDVMAGIVCAIIGTWLFQYFIKTVKGKKLLAQLIKVTSA